MDRETRLTETLRERFPTSLLLAVDPPTDAGFTFAWFNPWRLVANPAQLVAMSESLSDERFDLFLAGFVALCQTTLELLAAEDYDDVAEAVFDAQTRIAASMPHEYATLDESFFI